MHIEPKERIIIKKGKRLDGFRSDGTHYVEYNCGSYQLYAGNGKRLSAGKISYFDMIDKINKLKSLAK